MEQNKLQVMLAAYVLGEATDQERAEIERALESSPELRAERARLAATIGLVQEHLGGDALPESLSPESAATLERAAETRAAPLPSIRWYRKANYRIAASVMFAGLLWAGYTAVQSGDSSADSTGFPHDISGSDLTVASAPAAAEEQPVLERLRSLGYVDESSSDPSSAPRALDALGYSSGPVSVAKTEDLLARNEPSQDLQFEQTARWRSAGGKGAGRLKRDGEFRGPGDTVPLAYARTALAGKPLEGTPPAPASQAASGAPSGGGLRKQTITRGDRVWMPESKSEQQELEAYLGAAADKLARSSRQAESEALAADQKKSLRVLGYLADDDGDGDDFYLGHGELKERADFEIDGPSLQRSEFESCIIGLRRGQNENPRAMFFRFWGDNAFEFTALDRLSTFSADVDTASYTLARRYLMDGHLPTKAQVRTEEFVNYFDADVAAPTEDTFAIHTELAPSRFNDRSDAWMLRVVVAGKQVSRAERQPLTLTFVIDTSGSMNQDNRLELVKHSLRLLLGQLDARDSISLVAFSNEARLVLPMTSARNRDLIEVALAQLRPNGGTDAGAGLKLGYAQAAASLAAGTTNRVVLLSDGVANMGETDQARLNEYVQGYREQGIYLNTIGVGMGNHNDAFLEQLADNGDGLCNYIDDELEARRALVENFTGAFEPIARDVKIQVEFDPLQVEAYRLLGYENRALADRDFRNDAVDAGELNAGHQVVALYELIRTGRNADDSRTPLATVRLRWKRPYTEGVASRGDEVATEGFAHVRSGDAAASFAATSAGYRKSVLVAQFAEVLRRSTHATGDSFKDLLAETRALERELAGAGGGDGDFTELLDLMVRSRRLLLERIAQVDRWERARDQLRRSAYLVEQTRQLEGRLDDLKRSYAEASAGADKLAERVAWIRARLDRLEASLDDDVLREMELETAQLRARLARLLALLREVR